ncbi:histidine--tRNA ligase, partial [Rhabdaerophilum sp.]|uniref:histidine--tRNA ligase n=1 Tax=Rhabdaerophilum sp. TaxID=2717341 RepID=UPI0038D3CB26
LARYCAENWQNLPKPYRSYRAGWVFRNEKPGPGRFRQFMQFDADTVGAASVAADAEICMMAADTLDSLGLFELDANGNKRPLYVIKVNNRKILDGVMEAAGVRDDQKLTVLRAIDKADKFAWSEVAKLLGPGRRDESGDFTKGAGLNADQIEGIETFCNFQKLARSGGQPLEDVTNLTPDQRLQRANATGSEIMEFVAPEGGSASFFLANNLGVVGALERSFSNPTSKEGLAELRQIAELVESSGYFRDRIRIDPSVVRGLEYYTGPVFEAELLFEVKDEEGRPIRFGSVGGGGRYDGLVSRFLDEPVPATGFSIGVSRLRAALDKLAEMRGEKTGEVEGPVVVTLMPQDRGNAEAMASLQQIVSLLRNAKDEKGNPAGIPAELYLGPSGLKAQFKYADRRNSRVVLTQGEDERKAGIVQVKDLILGATLTDIKDRTEYLAKQAEAQFPAKISEVVEKVREVLARHR